uniref:Dymeclin n=1 Tax=Romanomermis culicivorax TaxID=13658 RepID=A0A915HZ98_ROMCU
MAHQQRVVDFTIHHNGYSASQQVENTVDEFLSSLVEIIVDLPANSIHAPFLTRVLLTNYVYNDERSSEIIKGYYDGGGSVILGLAASFANVLLFGHNESGSSSSENLPATLSTQSLYALLILSCHNCAPLIINNSEKAPINPYREALFSFNNSQGRKTGVFQFVLDTDDRSMGIFCPSTDADTSARVHRCFGHKTFKI